MMAYVDGELQGDQRRRFDEHLATCPECVRYLREYRATVHAGQSAYADELPADVPEDLVKAILDARKSR
jgi:anti-sigma factor RsiW